MLLEMDVCFLDIRYRILNGESIIDEICILGVDDNVFKPQHYTFIKKDFCPDCLMINLIRMVDIETTLFYVDDQPDGEKIKLAKKYLPKLRIVNLMNAHQNECCFIKCLYQRSTYLS
jgi:hypothetical protein